MDSMDLQREMTIFQPFVHLYFFNHNNTSNNGRRHSGNLSIYKDLFDVYSDKEVNQM